LIGVNIQYSSIAWYKQNLEHLCKIELGLIEVKYDIIYEQNYKSKCIVIYAIESKAIIIDKKLAELSFSYISYTKYISFKNTDSQNRIRCLYTNNCRNINGKFEILYNTNINKMLPASDDKWMLIKDHLLDVKDKNS